MGWLMYNTQQIIKLFRGFEKYNEFSDTDIITNLMPSLKLKQFVIYKMHNRVIGFMNYAFLNESEEDFFLKNKYINKNAWHSGNKLWIANLICKKNIKIFTLYLKNYFTKLIGINKQIQWIRLYKENTIHKDFFFTKQNFYKGNF